MYPDCSDTLHYVLPSYKSQCWSSHTYLHLHYMCISDIHLGLASRKILCPDMDLSSLITSVTIIFSMLKITRGCKIYWETGSWQKVVKIFWETGPWKDCLYTWPIFFVSKTVLPNEKDIYFFKQHVLYILEGVAVRINSFLSNTHTSPTEK